MRQWARIRKYISEGPSEDVWTTPRFWTDSDTFRSEDKTPP